MNTPHKMRRASPLLSSRLIVLTVFLMDMTAALKTVLSSVAIERSFLCSDGMKIAAQQWTNNNPAQQRILCLHGWLDNCRSFYRLAPSLVNANVVALDFVGHGWSSHKSADGPPSVMSEHVFYVAEAVRQLEWESFTLIGHSMGAAVSLIYAAAFPEQVEKLVLLEGAGPLTRNAKDVAKHVRASVERRQEGNAFLYPQYTQSESPSTKKPRTYPTIDLAVETRCKTAALSPGNQYLSQEASRAMVERATVQVDDGAVQFRHDARLQWPSLQYMTDEQVEGLYKDVTCPVCLILAEDGWPVDETRKEAAAKNLHPTVFKTLAGSHHFHADPGTANAVAQEVKAFLEI